MEKKKNETSEDLVSRTSEWKWKFYKYLQRFQSKLLKIRPFSRFKSFMF